MKKSFALFAAVGILASVSALAGPPKKGDKVAKVTDVWTCPITGEAIKDHKADDKGAVVGKYRVHFCCGGCPESFAKLSAKDKNAKVAEAVKKDKAGKAKG